MGCYAHAALRCLHTLLCLRCFANDGLLDFNGQRRQERGVLECIQEQRHGAWPQSVASGDGKTDCGGVGTRV